MPLELVQRLRRNAEWVLVRRQLDHVVDAEFPFDLADRLARDVRLDRVETPLRTKRHADPLFDSCGDEVRAFAHVSARSVRAYTHGAHGANVADDAPCLKGKDGVEIEFLQIRNAERKL